MTMLDQPILRLPPNVIQDTMAYGGQVDRFVRGDISPVAFRAYRVPMGVYEQRMSGTYMARIRIGAGWVTPAQLRRVAEQSKRYGSGIIHVTTRQDLQIHDLRIEDTPAVMVGLLEVGLSTRGGGGNTVRNVTACPMAGLCAKEVFNVSPHAVAVAEYLLQFGSSYNLPRKFKIAFSGCPEDCALASVADLGFFAHTRAGVRGFAVYAAGGLGSNPAVGVRIEEFIPEEEVFEVAEAVKRIFDEHGDRANKHKARLRYVLARVGKEEFVRLIRNERSAVAREGLAGSVPDLAECVGRLDRAPVGPGGDNDITLETDILPQKTPCLYTIRLRLHLGDIPADDLVRVSQIAEAFSQDPVRTTQQQDLLITSVPRASLTAIRAELLGLSIHVSSDHLPKIVACAGAATCKLGLCQSRALAQAVHSRLADVPISKDGAAQTVQISGCPNCCGQHVTAEIGLQGRAWRVGERLLPCYEVFVGGQVGQGCARLARQVATVPARRIPSMLAEHFASGSSSEDRLTDLAHRYSRLDPDELRDEDFCDWGSMEAFSLAGRGPGECGAGVMDILRADLDQAKTSLIATGGDQAAQLRTAAIVAARALLPVFGLEAGTEPQLVEAFRKVLVEPGWVEPEAGRLLEQAITYSNIEARQVQQLVTRIEQLFLSLDANLRFTIAPVTNAGPEQTQPPSQSAKVMDLRGVACPLNFVKAKLELERIGIGQALEILLDGGDPIRNVPASFTQQGQRVVAIESRDGHFSMVVQRIK